MFYGYYQDNSNNWNKYDGFVKLNLAGGYHLYSGNNPEPNGFNHVYTSAPLSAGQEREIHMEYDANDSLTVQIGSQNIVTNTDCFASLGAVSTLSVWYRSGVQTSNSLEVDHVTFRQEE